MEEWREIEGYEGLYEISNIGRVKSFKYNKQRILRLLSCGRGYYQVVLYNNKRIQKSIHRLVGIAFIPNPLNKLEINHKNGIKTDNKVSNLEWVTCKENIIHAFNNNLIIGAKGESNGRSKLNELQVRIIKKLDGDMYHVEIASIFNISNVTIGHIFSGYTWGHI